MTRVQCVAITPGEPARIGLDLVIRFAQCDQPIELVVCAGAVLLNDRAVVLGLPFSLLPYPPDTPAKP